jgi:hypothetical protein
MAECGRNYIDPSSKSDPFHPDMDARLATLLDAVDRAYDVRSWHGPNLRGSVRGVDARMAALRPAAGRHNVWEEVVHCAYWKYRVAYQLDDSAPRAFDEKGSDWFARPAVDAADSAWRGDLDRLASWHARLRTAIERFDPGRLDQDVGSGEFTYAGVIAGIAAHDLYHAGQIRLIRRMVGR